MTLVPSVDTAATVNELFGVACLSAIECSAVGTATDDSEITAATLIEHWDGRRWTGVVGKTPGRLLAIASASRTSVWAAGSQESRPLIEHFDDPATPYLAQPAPQWAPRFSDYRHLERVTAYDEEEW